MTAGLAPAFLREAAPEPPHTLEPATVEIDDGVTLDPSADLLRVELPDGSVRINLGPVAPLREATDRFDANLAEHLDGSTLATIAEDLLRKIADDDNSRSEWLRMRAEGIGLLGWTIAPPQQSGAGTAAPVAGQATIKHPLIAEAAIRFQANARGELLPAEGPVKIRNDDPSAPTDKLASALERDMNRYLTVTDKDYVPDTDRMLFWVGLGGCAFKKIYSHPLKQRPVSESVDAEDLIVNNAAVSLQTRVTHRIRMAQSTLKRMQLVGAYRTCDLVAPQVQAPSAPEQAKQEASGVTVDLSADERDRPHELYECYCELDIPGYEHRKDGEITGLQLPYRVVIEKDSRQILEVRRNWREGDDLCLPKDYFVGYHYLPAIGFYSIGLAHILADTTRAATGGWRIGLDCGMFANFPGFLFARPVGRQNTTQIRVPPGGGAPIDTSGVQGGDIGKAVMPLPYRDMGPAFQALLTNIVETGARLGGVAEIQVGEGRQDAPVGTTMALIEQAIKPLDAVHKRLHAAQAQEFQLLRDLFMADPEAFWRGNKRPAQAWTKELLLQALNNYDLSPAADPNTASALQRIGKAQALYMLAKDNPRAFDQRAVYQYVMSEMKIGNADAFLVKQVTEPQDKLGDAALLDAQARHASAQGKVVDAQIDAEQRALDRQSREAIEQMKVAADLAKNAAQPTIDPAMARELEAMFGAAPAVGPDPRIQ